MTGAGGFIGSHLSHYLEDRYNIFNVLSKSSRFNFKNSIRLDLCNHGQVRAYFKKFSKQNKIDTVIHLASRLASVQAAEDTSILYENIKLSESLVEIAKLLKPKKIIHFSSMAVYPQQNGLFGESSPVRPSKNGDCCYGLSKFCSENVLDFLLRKHNMTITHLRISQVYGPGMREDRIIPVMLRELRQKNTITIFGNGERIVNFIHVEKLLPIVDFFIQRDLPGIFNVGDEEYSILQLAQKLIRQNGNKNSRIVKESRGSRIKFHLDTSKIRKLLKTKSSKSLRD